MYQQVCEMISYYYNEEDNCLMDENGYPFFGMYEHMEPWEYQKYKRYGGVVYIEADCIMYEYIFSSIDENEEWMQG